MLRSTAKSFLTGLGLALGVVAGVATASFDLPGEPFKAGDQLSASALNSKLAAIEDAITGLQQTTDALGGSSPEEAPAFLLRLSLDAAASVTLEAWGSARIPFDSAEIDTEDTLDVAKHTYHIPRGGIWQFSANFRTGPGTYEISVCRTDASSPAVARLAGSAVLMNIGMSTNPAGGSENGIALSGLLSLDAGDEIHARITAYQSSSGIGYGDGVFLSGHLVRPLSQ